jgi:lysophospholipase L1-like esterase
VAGEALNQFLKNMFWIKWDGIAYSPNFVTGGVFSLDGIHLTPRGNALVANELIKVINAKYGSTLPAVNGNAYPGIKFP